MRLISDFKNRRKFMRFPALHCVLDTAITVSEVHCLLSQRFLKLLCAAQIDVRLLAILIWLDYLHENNEKTSIDVSLATQKRKRYACCGGVERK